MGNFIIALIGIVLITIITGATTYFLSDAYTDSRLEAEIARYHTEASQINSAVDLYIGHGNVVDSDFSLQKLIDMRYLKQIPENWTEYTSMIGVEMSGEALYAERLCYLANKKAGFTYVPDGIEFIAYTDDTSKGIPLCDSESAKDAPCCIYE